MFFWTMKDKLPIFNTNILIEWMSTSILYLNISVF